MSTIDYKSTVNLPETDFPMKAGLTQREPEILARWEAEGLYAQMREQGKTRQRYLLHDGPPYANGDLHAGHALNKVLKDIVVKSKQMSGFDAPFVPGWDCHGLPIEHKVVNELGDKAKTMSQVEIRRQCRAFALRYVDQHRQGFKRLGVTGDWERPYLTLSPEYVATIVRVFGEMYLKGVVYKGLKPIYWCPSCETALAEAEVEYANHASPSVYVKFEATDPVPGVEGKVSFVIWTTTPWTLPANLAISVHPEFEYSAIKIGDETLIMASLLAPGALEACGIQEYTRLKTFAGVELEGLHYRHVFAHDRICPIICGDHVTLEAGTGCVHTAPGHGQEDYVVGARYGIAPFSPVDHRGCFTAEGGAYTGLHVFKANPRIVEDLTAQGSMLGSSKIEHSYPHCWRCSKPVIYRSTPQWFINVDHEGLRDKLLDGVNQVTWVPDWGKERIHGMIAQRPDWCISRQRAWGVPIPVFYCASCQEPHATAASLKKIEELALSAADGIDRWFDTAAAQLLPAAATCAKCGGTEFRTETDILDVWFDSGVSNRAVCELRPELGWPADMYLEGSDQHRGWFQASIIPSVAVKGCPPYRTVVTHGYVVDGEGKKMSKKLGNSMDLKDLTEGYGADIARLWITGENYRQDIRVSKEILTRMQDAYRRIRNTFRYMLANLGDFGPTAAVPYDQLMDVDRWALHQAQLLKQRILKAYETYEFHQVYHAAHNFCAVEMSSFYLDILKDRLYTFAKNARERRAGQTAMAEILTDLLRLLAPVLVFTTDEAWQYLPAHLKTETSVHLATFPAVKQEYVLADEALSGWDALLRLRGVVSKVLEEARRAKAIGTSLEAELVLAPGDAATESLLREYAPQLPGIFIVSKCTLAPVSKEAAATEAKLVVSVARAPGEKCVRCWNYKETVGTVSEHPLLCDRCVDQLGELAG
ncbi:MAG TPA: isoleucine--tRNA ligase [Candidatus Hydrogenedentes bacterium]|nr:isoleucine--tRNA ligase [Candidatus Hydrogenedentota bacterium]